MPYALFAGLCVELTFLYHTFLYLYKNQFFGAITIYYANIKYMNQNKSSNFKNNIDYIKNIAPLIFKKNDEIIDFSKKETQKWKENSDGLYVIIHGLKSRPCLFGKIILNTVKKNIKMEKYDIVVPKVPFEGNCSLKNASTPIYYLILDYIDKNPNKPIHMIGSSNGCRICSYIETKIRHIDINIRISALSGAYGGSTLVENYSTVLSYMLHKDLVEDMKLNSKVNNKLKKKMLMPITKGSRYYEFYASTNDLVIPNISDCFPDVNANTVVNHELIENTGHINLVHFVHEEILNNSIEWMSLFDANNLL